MRVLSIGHGNQTVDALVALLIAPSLIELGVVVEHIQPDGSLAAHPPRQLSLFPLV